MDAPDEAARGWLADPRPDRIPLVESFETELGERVNRKIKRGADVIGIFPNDDSIVRIVGALAMETNDEWAWRRR